MHRTVFIPIIQRAQQRRGGQKKRHCQVARRKVCGQNEDNRWRTTTKTMSLSSSVRKNKKRSWARKFSYIGTCGRAAILPWRRRAVQKLGAFCLLATDSLTCILWPAATLCTMHMHTYKARRCGSVWLILIRGTHVEQNLIWIYWKMQQ